MADFPNAPLVDQVYTVNGVSYKWDGEKWVTSGVAGGGDFLPLAGGTMTGPIILAGDPNNALDASTKRYTDTKILRAGDSMTGFLSLSSDPNLPLHAVSKQYLDRLVGSLVAGVDLIGVYDATLSVIRWTTDSLYSGNTLPAPAPENKGMYVMCAIEGSVPPLPATPEYHSAGDWLLSDGISEWFHIYIANRVDATQVPTNPAVAGQPHVQAALEVMVPVAGATMTGTLTLSGDPLNPLHAATKQYADAADLAKVAKAGDTMTGALTLSGAPVSPLHASTKQYVDARVVKAGDVMTGPLTLPADPTAPLHAATKSYVDAVASGGPPGGYVPISGGVMTGPLTLAADPTTPLMSATKQYVDSHVPYTTATPPAAPIAGMLWFDPATLQLYIWYDDGNSAQWVVAINQVAAVTAIYKLSKEVDELRKLIEKV